MSAPVKSLIMDRGFPSSYDRSIAGKVSATMEKLFKDPTTNGLHVEPLRSCADPRVRTARVDKFHRMVLFDLDTSYLLYGVYGHDQAYLVAERVYARVNPTSGAAEIRQSEPVPAADAPTADGTAANGERVARYTDSELHALVEARAAEKLAEWQTDAAPTTAQPAADRGEDAPGTVPSGVGEQGASREAAAVRADTNPLARYEAADLVAQLGIDQPTAEYAVSRAGEAQLLTFLSRVPGWQADALLDVASGSTLDEVHEAYSVAADGTAGYRGTELGVPSDSEAVVRAATAQQAGSQFQLIADDRELEKALANGNFDEWRLFLHPDQREYVSKRTQGPFRLSGGAGTGKTVVLVHRAAHLARANPDARVLLVSFTRNLVDMIAAQVRALDPALPVHGELGRPGIAVLTMDQVAARVLDDAAGSTVLPQAMEHVLGWGVRAKPGRRSTGSYGANPWDDVLDAAGNDLPDQLRSVPFFQSEYQEVILPQHVVSATDYVRTPRPGRGSRLGRKQRQAVWRAIAQYRADGLAQQALDWDEAAAVAAELLSPRDPSGYAGIPASERTRLMVPRADHVLIDEGQDFTPTRWLLARALVAPGPDDVFIAEDSNQRIYGNRIVLGRYGIKIVGRSRRLRLNYRTTEQNLELALAVLEGGAYDVDSVEEDVEGPEHRTARESDRYISSRRGPIPRLMPAEDLSHEFTLAAQLIKEWVLEAAELGLGAETIGILTRTKKVRDMVVRGLGDLGVSVAPVDVKDAPAGIPAVMTMHRAKGTEFSRVLLFGVSKTAIPRFYAGSTYDEQAREDTDLRERSLLYVGATRARDKLAITWDKEASPFLPVGAVE